MREMAPHPRLAQARSIAVNPKPHRFFAGSNGGQRARDTKICHFESLIWRDKQVMWLDIAMYKAGAVSITYARAGLNNQWNAFLNCKTSALTQETLHILARNELHDDVHNTIFANAKIMDCDNIGMGKIGRGTCFLTEAFLKSFVARVIFTQELDRDVTIKHQIARAEYTGHAAGAELLKQLIAFVESAPSFMFANGLYHAGSGIILSMRESLIIYNPTAGGSLRGLL